MGCVRVTGVRSWAAALLLVACLSSAGPALAANAVHALYVGVDDYRFGGPGAEIQDLRGASNDIEMIRKALTARHEINSEKILLGAQATRAAILGALADIGQTAQPGDTLFFYFTGHGRRFLTRVGDQPDGYNVTIAAYDALPPSRISPDRNYDVGQIGDIFDRELSQILDAMTARGINVVSVFDSCNSGTATRSLFRPKAGTKGIAQSEGVVLRLTPPTPSSSVATTPTNGSAQGYRVHLAAAPDGATAQENEVEEDGQKIWRSDFTVAFSTALLEAREGVTYQEILAVTRSNLARIGAQQQDLRTDGDLLIAFLGSAASGPRPLPVIPGIDGAWTVSAGTLSGINVGARFDIYASLSDALAGSKPPLAKAIVRSTNDWTAALDFVGRPPGGPVRGFARETSRSFAGWRLKVAIGFDGVPTPAARKTAQAVQSALAAYSAVRIVPTGAQVGFVVNGDGALRLTTADLTLIQAFDAGWADQLPATMQKVIQYFTLLELDDHGKGPPIRFEAADSGCDERSPERFTWRAGEPALLEGQTLHLRYRNDSETPLYVYVFDLGADHSISLIVSSEEPVRAGRCFHTRHGPAFGEGRDHLILIASSRALPDLRRFQQGGTRAVGAPPSDPLERLLWDSATGQRSTGAANIDVGAWSVRRLTYTTSPSAAASPGQ